jgi:hypothetical protein
MFGTNVKGTSSLGMLFILSYLHVTTLWRNFSLEGPWQPTCWRRGKCFLYWIGWTILLYEAPCVEGPYALPFFLHFVDKKKRHDMLVFKYKSMKLVTINLGHESDATLVFGYDNCYCLWCWMLSSSWWPIGFKTLMNLPHLWTITTYFGSLTHM